MHTAIIVHGGAGAWESKTERLQLAVQSCIEAATLGKSILDQGGSALDAVEAAVRILEDSPVLNAGRGSHLNAQNNIEMDALIMDGRTLDLGAITAVQRIRHPISLARLVLEKSDHNMLTGYGAEKFAMNIAFPRCELSDLMVPDRIQIANDGPDGDTVGAVAIDDRGNLAAATSTGGTESKFPGRVGDSPLVGSGGYADNHTAAASATGRGEDLMKVVISKQVCDLVARGASTQSACETAIKNLESRVNGSGGLIAIDRQGQIGVSYNTYAMPYAYYMGDNPIVSGT